MNESPLTVLCVCVLVIMNGGILWGSEDTPDVAAESQWRFETETGGVGEGVGLNRDMSYRPLSNSASHANEQMKSEKMFAMAGSNTSFSRSFSLNAMSQTDPVETKSSKREYTDEEIAEMISNPLGNLWLLFTQHDVTWYEGKLTDGDSKVMHSTKLMPVMPLKFDEEWSVILRPVIQYNSFTAPTGFDVVESEPAGIDFNFDREYGFGDTILMASFSNKTKPPYIFGFGPTFMFPTASDDMLGTGKWAAGPSMIAVYLSEKWIIGNVTQHWWSYAGDGDRDSVNLTDTQPILRYRLTPETNIGLAPNIQYNWNIDQWTIPIGIGADTLIKIGPLPVKVGVEYYHYLEQNDLYGQDWGLRFMFVPVVPSPGWAKTPLF